MIISCEQCNKKFEIDSILIPSEGRLLKCGSCDHEWFFKEIKKNEQDLKNKDDVKLQNDDEPILNQTHEDNKTDDSLNDSIDYNFKIPKKKRIKNIGLLNSILILIVSLIAFIIMVDTFKKPLSNFVPEIEFILNNLYETFKDIKLFLLDLI
jgi:predicted Zn finger-like uncharacterized protein